MFLPHTRACERENVHSCAALQSREVCAVLCTFHVTQQKYREVKENVEEVIDDLAAVDNAALARRSIDARCVATEWCASLFG